MIPWKSQTAREPKRERMKEKERECLDGRENV